MGFILSEYRNGNDRCLASMAEQFPVIMGKEQDVPTRCLSAGVSRERARKLAEMYFGKLRAICNEMGIAPEDDE
jgi:hypothetical protein